MLSFTTVTWEPNLFKSNSFNELPLTTLAAIADKFEKLSDIDGM